MQVIVYATGAVGCAVVGPNPDLDFEDVVAQAVPGGAAHVLVDAANLPISDQAGWTIKDGKVVVPAPGLDALKAYIAAKRYAVEIAGASATVGGEKVVVSTARDNRDGMRDTILRILVGARKDGDVLKIFADGVPRAATNAEAQAAITAASDHVQAAFNVEGDLVKDATATPPTITTYAQVDASSWPAAA